MWYLLDIARQQLPYRLDVHFPTHPSPTSLIITPVGVGSSCLRSVLLYKSRMEDVPRSNMFLLVITH